MAFWKEEQPSQQVPSVTPPAPASQPSMAPSPEENTGPSFEERFNQLMKNAARTPAIDLAIQISDLIMEQAVQERASDVHLEYQGTALRVRFRIDGTLQDVANITSNDKLPISQRIRVLAGFDPESAAKFQMEEGRFQKIIAGRRIQLRVSTFPTVNGEKLVLRILDRTQMGLDIDQLGMTKEDMDTLNRVANNPYGIFYVTGATGSGKTTTLYALLKLRNTPMVNIISLEDPVEYRLEGINQAQISSKTGFGWKEGLMTVLRQDPDIVMVGEIRDNSSAEITMRAALTGHLIFTTMHTISAPGVVERLFEMGTPHYLIASSMLGGMSQRLVRRICPHCAQNAAPPSEQAVNEFVEGIDPVEAKLIKEIIFRPGATFKLEKGCPKCRNTGYLGRTGIFEIMIMNEELRKKVLEHSPTDDLKRVAVQSGMKTLLMDGIYKASCGVTTIGEVLRVTATMS
ncbi:MAG: GspE/PulE family protein [Elusimicrobiaceae bacterium]